MREVSPNQDHARVGFYKSVLDQPAFPTSSAPNGNKITEIFAVVLPALCVVNDEHYDEACEFWERFTTSVHPKRPTGAAPNVTEVRV